MYSKRFLQISRLGVYFAVLVLVGVTLFGSIAPASPTLERTKREIDYVPYFLVSCLPVTDHAPVPIDSDFEVEE